VLIRMRGKGRGHEHWLLMKMHDAFARPAGRTDVNAQERGSMHASPRHSRLSARIPAYTSAKVRRTTEPPEAGVTSTHTVKRMYPESGITKGDVLDFYRRIAPRLLPYLRDRPTTLERHEGLGDSDAPHFWQKRTPTIILSGSNAWSCRARTARWYPTCWSTARRRYSISSTRHHSFHVGFCTPRRLGPA
jgi:bifunctional non-homologous end joining protein LigD